MKNVSGFLLWFQTLQVFFNFISIRVRRVKRNVEDLFETTLVTVFIPALKYLVNHPLTVLFALCTTYGLANCTEEVVRQQTAMTTGYLKLYEQVTRSRT